MALQGTIDGFGVVDVLQLLSASRKSGRLVIEGDRGVGQLFVVDGELTGGSIRGQDAEDGVAIVFELLRFGDGAFLFEPGSTSGGVGFTPTSVAGALQEAEARLEAWAAIEALVPSGAHRLALEPELGEDDVVLTAGDWQVVVAAGAGASVADFASEVGLDELAACTVVAGLVDRGLVRVEEPVAVSVAAPVDSVPALPAATEMPASEVPAAEAHVEVAPAEVAPTGAGEPYMAAVLITEEEPAAEEGFPEHFPIDDLLGSEDGAGWVTLEGEAVDDERFAAAQPFTDGDDGLGQGVGFTHPAFGDDPFSDPAVDAGPDGHGDPAFSGPAADGAFSDPAFSEPTFSDGAFSEPTFSDGGFSAPAASDGGSSGPAFSDAAFDPAPADAAGIPFTGGADVTGVMEGAGVTEAAGSTEPGGFTDGGAFTDPVPDAAAATTGDGAFLAAESGRSPLAVQDPEVRAFTPAPAPPTSADTATDEVLKQMSKLSPKAAEAIAAALGSAAREPDEPADGGGTFLSGF